MWVKICGLTSVTEALSICELMPDAIGLNFYQQSPRSVSVDVAAEICRQLPAGILPVGLFVDHSPQQIMEITRRTGIQALQLHGDYCPAITPALPPLPIIWAYRMGLDGLTGLQLQMPNLPVFDSTTRTGVWSYLVDARVPGQFGGSGHQVDWRLLATQYDPVEIPRLVLAGGLTPDNVAAAIATVQPWGVDVASGVESAGKKDREKCREFLLNARR